MDGHHHRMIDRVLFLVAGADADIRVRRESFFMAASPGLVATEFGLMQTGLKSRLARIETALPKPAPAPVESAAPPDLGLAGPAPC